MRASLQSGLQAGPLFPERPALSDAAPTATAAPPPKLTYRQTVIILSGLMLGMFLGAFDQTSIATALPTIARDIGGAEYLSWVIAAYLLASTAATPIYGKLSDLYGRKPMLQVAICIFVGASFCSANAESMLQLIVFRTIQGIGAGGLVSMAHATIADIISPRERGRYQPYIASAFTMAMLTGPIVGGLFVDHLSWRYIFWLNIVVGLGALYMSQRTLKHLVVKRVRHSIDYAGAALIVATVACLILAMSIAGQTGHWDSVQVLSLVAGAVVLGIGVVIRERVALDPILPPRLFSNRIYVVANSMNFLLSANNFGLVIMIPIFLQVMHRMSPSEAGLFLLPLTVTGPMGAITAGRTMAATGRYKFLPITGLTFTTVGTAMLALAAPGSSMLWLMAAGALVGFGGGLVGPVTMVATQNSVAVRDLGTGTSSISFFRSMGGALGVSLLSAVLISQLNLQLSPLPNYANLGAEPGLHIIRGGAAALDPVPQVLMAEATQAVVKAFDWTFLICALFAFTNLCLALFLRELPLKTSSGREREGVGGDD